MDNESFFSSNYNGSKGFTQLDVPTANATGFGAAADDYMERGIDLNEQLIMNKPATFFFRMTGDAMTGAGINSGDILVVDRSLKEEHGRIIVAAIEGELIVRRLVKTLNKKFLCAENPKYKNIEVGEFSAYQSWGVVTCLIHIMDNSLAAFVSNKKKNG